MQVKLDELIRALKQADNTILDSENLTEQELKQLQKHYSQLAQHALSRLPHKNATPPTR